MNGWLQITAGRGPEECRWVVRQLATFLIHVAARDGLRVDLVEAIPGDLPGTLRSALLSVNGGSGVSGFISDWQGSVQWIGLSMFRPHHRRRNWFVSVDAFQAAIGSEWDTRDIRIERMRSSGPGGQHANKTETAIRVTHVPTGLCAVSQEERSQFLNKRLALARLRELLRRKERQTERDFDRMRWHLHDAVVRGNAVHVFKGAAFRPVP